MNRFLKCAKLALFGLSLCSVLFYQTAAAEKADRDKPSRIDSEHLAVDERSGLKRYSGNVVFTQGTTRLTAEIVEVQRQELGQFKLIAKGDRVKYRSKVDGKEEYLDAEAKQMTYNSAKDELVLQGEGWVRRGDGEVRGPRIVFDLKQQQYQVFGDSSSRVRAVLQPSKSQSLPSGQQKGPIPVLQPISELGAIADPLP